MCWLKTGHGDVNAILGLAYSCDVYFYKIGGGYPGEVEGIGLGIERLGRWMQIYGLGQFTGIELAGEIDGTIPSPAWKRRTWGENWSTGDTYNSAFGQGYVLATPLQM
ncbi:MAG: penicillin-binding transpeptidase domain-containing protein, partial [Candidatus Hadarchaeum sp.]